MTRWIIIGLLIYVLFVFAAWSLCRAAAIESDTFDWGRDPDPRPCPSCHSSDVYVDGDDVCLCITCRASYPLTHATRSS